jgi:signal transduction histidine kinase/ligand-binding sensor domain-containing protein/AraC-like DNA-binding protein
MFKWYFLLLIIQFNAVFSQINFTHIDSSKGLPGSVIRKIIQDKDGFMWFATSTGLAKYDGYKITIVSDNNGESLGDVWSLLNINDGSVLIASRTKGLYSYKQGSISKVESIDNFDIKNILAIALDANNDLWLGSESHVYKIKNNRINKIKTLHDEKSYNFLNVDQHHILGLTSKNVFMYNTADNSVQHIPSHPSDDKINSVLYKDVNGNILLGRENGLFLYNDKCQCFNKFIDALGDYDIYSLTSDQDYLWIGTIYHGLFRWSYKTQSLDNYTHSNKNRDSISDNTIMSLYTDITGITWVGTFNAGVSYIKPNSLELEALTNDFNKSSCMGSSIVHDIFQSSDKSTWFATNDGLINIDVSGNCKVFKHEGGKTASLSSNQSLSISESANGELWISNSISGLDKITPKQNEVKRIENLFKGINFYFSVEFRKDKLLLGSHLNGLYLYNIVNGTYSHIDSEQQEFANNSFYAYAVDKYNRYFFATSNGVAWLDKDNKLQRHPVDFQKDKQLDVATLSFDVNNNLWMAINGKYLLKQDPLGQMINLTNYLVNNRPIRIVSIIAVDDDILWLATYNKGIYKFNSNTLQSWNLTAEDGLKNNNFLANSWHQDQMGKIFFGGKNGVDSFNPNDITINLRPPNVVLTSFSYMNKELSVGVETKSGLKLNKPINTMDMLKLGYQDYIIGFEFAALDYSDPERNQYAYRLLGLNDNWVFTNANNRTVTYTNLKPAEYTFQVKASNKDGTWSTVPKSIKLKVYPAPWFTLWAYLLYFMLFIFALWSYVRYKTIASRNRATELEIIVNERTQEIKLQKTMVESLLQHKNEVFANITHEFNTPLSLIIGPIEQLKQEVALMDNKNILDMVQRNAKRLLLMVAQILKLSQAEVNREITREPQKLMPILSMLFESFLPLAKNKNITLKISNKHDVNIYATPECIEMVVGNLLSNALKFTNPGGQISINTVKRNKHISISVEDTGIGIESKNQDRVFNRFVSLDSHSGITGTGIGLSVVKEITELNNGHVSLKSEWGKGTKFTITFQVSDMDSNNVLTHVMVDQLVDNTHNVLTYDTGSNQQIQPDTENQTNVLIIDDNLDMQTHIGNVLQTQYKCMFSERGKDGIRVALETIPDIVICDVMMPGMDGYQVTRILRHDSRTSHIPIILLTALNTRESRIKGWRENIDRYISKPFDGNELIIQIENILTIRQILQNRTSKAIRNNSLTSLDLPKQDLDFIEKLKDIIGEHYANEYYQIADFAAKMAVSERQLQRKVKALINISPMDMLRDYRLQKAALKLKDGYQVTMVSDQCGFNNVSYFCRCFKKKYGITPKAYQMLSKNS